MFEVYIFEFERGWGSRVDEIKEFETKDEADEFIKTFNSQNTSPTAPDWYMQAEPNY